MASGLQMITNSSSSGRTVLLMQAGGLEDDLPGGLKLTYQ